MIRKGRRINQINGRRKINISANGQHNAKRINQRKIAIKVFIIVKVVLPITNNSPN